MALQGGDELRARLAAISDSFEPIAYQWTKDAVGLMKARVHSPSGHLRRSIYGKAGSRAALVFADYRVTFQDKGTKKHTVKVKKAKVLTSGYPAHGGVIGETVFARRAEVRGVKKKPFIRKSARDALKSTDGAAEIIKAWNAAGGRGRKYTLGNTTATRRRREARALRKVT